MLSGSEGARLLWIKRLGRREASLLRSKERGGGRRRLLLGEVLPELRRGDKAGELWSKRSGGGVVGGGGGREKGWRGVGSDLRKGGVAEVRRIRGLRSDGCARATTKKVKVVPDRRVGAERGRRRWRGGAWGEGLRRGRGPDGRGRLEDG